jgi:hypothetical protein
VDKNPGMERQRKSKEISLEISSHIWRSQYRTTSLTIITSQKPPSGGFFMPISVESNKNNQFELK